MKKLSLHSDISNDMIEIPIVFIDRYMPQATAAALKVYLYLLRAAKDRSILLSVNDMADLFDVTPNKILQSLSYWESQDLLSLTFTDGELSDITLRPVSRSESAAPAVVPDRPLAEERPSAAAVVKESAPPNVQPMPYRAPERRLPLDLSVLSEDEAFGELLALAEFYLKKPLNASTRDALGYCYLIFDRQSDVIEYLIEYCIERGHSSPHYMKGVADGWKRDGLHTLEDIREEKTNRTKSVYSVMNAFGLNRSPVREELRYIEQWNADFPSELIQEAVSRTMSALSKPSFSYADSILSRWKEAGISSLKEVETLDRKHKESQKKAEQADGAKRGRSSAFRNFDERDVDYSKLIPSFYQKQS